MKPTSMPKVDLARLPPCNSALIEASRLAYESPRVALYHRAGEEEEEEDEFDFDDFSDVLTIILLKLITRG